MTAGSPASITAMQELVVPRSIPNTLAILVPPYLLVEIILGWEVVLVCDFCRKGVLLYRLLFEKVGVAHYMPQCATRSRNGFCFLGDVVGGDEGWVGLKLGYSGCYREKGNR